MTGVHAAFPVHGTATAWAALGDPARVRAALPGCTGAARVDGGGLRLDVDLAVASVRGPWTGTATPVDERTVRVMGAGGVGSLDLLVRVDADRTQLTVDGTVGGPLAAIGSGLLAAAVRRTATDLLAALATAPATPAEAPVDPTPVDATGAVAAPPGTAPTIAIPAASVPRTRVGGTVLAALAGLVVGIAVGRRAPGSRR